MNYDKIYNELLPEAVLSKSCMTSWRDNISFILVEPEEPGNIGASARALKNMGFKRLELVRPKGFQSIEARAFAHGAENVLDEALIHKDLSSAIRDKSIIAGTTRRLGRKRGLILPLKEGVKRLQRLSKTNKVAILFGRESKGLSNKEVDECGLLITIPADRACPSLNLSQTVLLIAYELAGTVSPAGKGTASPAGKGTASPAGKGTAGVGAPCQSPHRPCLLAAPDLDFLMSRMQEALKRLGYRRDMTVKIMQGLKHLIRRTGLTEWELRMLHGILTQMDRSRDKT